MIVFLVVEETEIQVMALAEGQDIIGDLPMVITPGESIFGYSFDELKKLGDGQHQIEDRS